MAKKRKHDVAVNNASEAVKKQQLVPPTQVNPPKEEEFEYEEVEEEVEEDEDEEEDDDSEDDEEAEPILQLLEPFTKDILMTLLNEAAKKHRDVAKRIREVADEDPVHRKIFVHGLGWDTNTETLLNAFRQYGEIEDCKSVTDKNTGKSKGYGFILFKSRTGACNALKEPQKKIRSRMTACQLAAVGPGPSNQAAAAQSQSAPTQPASEYTQRKIYVSNVSADIDPKKLTEFFGRYGEIEEGPLGLDKMTGKPKGFCLFVYRSVESSRKALEEPHKNFEGHMLHCQRAIDGPKHGKNQHQNNAQSSQFQSSSSFGGGAVGQFGQGTTGMGYSQGQVQAAAAMPALNPVLGQALTALLTAPGAGLGQLTNLLGTLGSAAAISQGAGHGLQAAYGSQINASSGVIGGYGTQGGYSGGQQQQQLGQGASGRGQQSGQYPGSGPYLGQ